VQSTASLKLHTLSLGSQYNPGAQDDSYILEPTHWTYLLQSVG